MMIKKLIILLSVCLIISCATTQKINQENIELGDLELKVIDGSQNDTEISVAKASLDLSSIAPGFQPEFDDFQINSDRSRIVQSAYWKGEVEVSLKGQGFPPDSKALIRNLTIDEKAVFADELIIFPDSDLPLSFSGAELLPGKDFPFSAAKKDIELRAYGTAINLEGVSINGGKLKIDKADIAFDREILPHMEFQELEIKNGEWTGGQRPSDLKIKKDLSTFTIQNPSFGIDGISGPGRVKIDEKYKFADREIPSLVLDWNGELHSRPVKIGQNDRDDIFIGNFYCELDEWQIKNNGLLCSKLDFPMPGMLGGEKIGIEGLFIAADGQVNGPGKCVREATVDAYNGFEIKVKNIAGVTDTHWLFNGYVDMPQSQALKIDRIGDNSTIFYFDQNGFLTSDEIVEKIEIEYLGLKLFSGSYEIGRSGLVLSQFTYYIDKDNFLLIPGAQFYSDGYVKNKLGYIDKSINAEIMGWKFEILDTALTDEGIDISSFIYFPESLGGGNVYLNSMQLFEINDNLNITSSAYVPYFELENDGYRMEINDMFWDNGTFFADEVKVYYPREAGRKSKSYSGVNIYPDGMFRVGSKKFFPFE